MKAKTRQNFISTDKKTVRNSYGDFFTVGETVGHEDEGAETAVIISFEPKIEENEITVQTQKGFVHLDFIVKL